MKTSFYTNYSNLNFQGKTSAITTERLKKLAETKPVHEIIAELGISVKTYYKLIKARGITGIKQKLISKSSNAKREQIENLIKQNKSVAEICEQLQITQNSYFYYLEKFNIITPRKQLAQHNASITKEQLLELINSGKKYDEIIKELNISSTAYKSLVAHFGIVTKAKESKQRISQITKELLENLIENGKTVKEICKELEIPERTYTRLLNKFGIITKRQQYKQIISKITKEKLQALVDTELPVDEICTILQINKTTFYRLLKRLKIDYNYEHHHGEIVIPKQILKNVIESGKSTTEISKELGIAVSTFHRKALEADVKTVFRDSIDKITSIPREKIQNLINAGMSVKKICKILNISISTYRTILHKFNLDTPFRQAMVNISQISKKQLIEQLKMGKTIKEICKDLKISQSSYSRIMKEN